MKVQMDDLRRLEIVDILRPEKLGLNLEGGRRRRIAISLGRPRFLAYI